MLFSIFFLENASQIGLRIPEVIDSLPYQKQRSQKSASGNERGPRGAGAARSLRTLGVGGSEAPLGRSAQGPPARRGVPFLPKMGRKRAGGKPLDYGFMARLLSLARFGDRSL